MYKSLGCLLTEADLISLPQVQLALQEQKQYSNLRLGEILALHGWLKQETADFFAQKWLKSLQEAQKNLLGYYLQEAGLLTLKQINTILDEQRRLGIKFGSIAVIHGWLKKKTLEFFLKHLAPERLKESVFIKPYKHNFGEDKEPTPMLSETNEQKKRLIMEEIRFFHILAMKN